MATKIFCDKCGKEMTYSEGFYRMSIESTKGWHLRPITYNSKHDLCIKCCKEIRNSIHNS